MDEPWRARDERAPDTQTDTELSLPERQAAVADVVRQDLDRGYDDPDVEDVAVAEGVLTDD